mgnify:CR=1 FL=1
MTVKQWVTTIFLFMFSATTTSAMPMTQTNDTKRITLVGASIGKDWNFDRVAERLKISGYDFRYMGKYDFDKSELIDTIVGQSRKSDIVMIKECSSYFPGDSAKQRAFVQNWVGKLRAAGVQPVLVTVAPVKAPGLVQRGKNLVKKVMGKPVWPEEVAAFNDWLREYAARERLPLFDLERALSIAPDQRYLKPEFSTDDDVHLSRAAYERLDREFEQFLSGIGIVSASR